jgi:hypothetical protein
MGFAPCVPCKQTGAGCFMGAKNSVKYHQELVRLKVMVYDHRCDFMESRKIKPEVRSRYERGMGHAMLEDGDEEEEAKEGAGGHPMTRQLVDTIHRLREEIGWMQLQMQGMMGDMYWVMQELQRVNENHSTSAAPPPDEYFLVARPITGPVGETNSTPLVLPDAYGIRPTDPLTPTIDSWMYHPSFNTPTESTWIQSNNVSLSDTHPYQFPAVPQAGTPTTSTTRDHTDIYQFDPVYQDDSGPQYGEGSSTGLSARETGELWQQDFADGDESMN